MRLPHLALVVSLLAPAVAAQIKNVPQPIEPGGEVHVAGEEGGSADEPSKTVDGKLMDAKAAAEAANMPRHARGMCHMVSAIHPNRIAPGTTGTGIVTMILEGDAVLTAPAPVQFQYVENQGPVTLAAAAFRPAKKARIAQAFAGREAYDNYAIFEVPLTVAAGTPHGRQQVNMVLTFDLHHAQSGALLGKFSDSVTIDIEVGIPTASSNLMQVGGAGAAAVPGGQGGLAPSTLTPAPQPKPPELTFPNRPEVQANLPAGETPPGATPSAPAEPLGGDPIPLVDEGGGLPILMVAMVAGSLLVLVILMLVLRKK